MSEELNTEQTGNRDDAVCVHCSSNNLTDVSSEFDHLENNVVSICDDCGKYSRHFYNMELYEAEAASAPTPTKSQFAVWYIIENREFGGGEGDWEEWNASFDTETLLSNFVVAFNSEELDEVNREWRIRKTYYASDAVPPKQCPVCRHTEGENVENRIATVWCIEDVQCSDVRPDLNNEQARGVLRETDRRHDANVGISWEVLNIHAGILFPENQIPESQRLEEVEDRECKVCEMEFATWDAFQWRCWNCIEKLEGTGL